MSDLIDSGGASLGDAGGGTLIDSGAETGASSDIVSRLQRWLPAQWFPSGAGTRLYAQLCGFASALASIYQQIAYASCQARLQTSSDGFVDLWSLDFFGTDLPRAPGEQDAAYAARIKANLFIPRGTRAALTSVLQNLTGNTPQIDYAWHPGDVGAYGYGNLGYGGPGYYGSLQLNAQIFITIAAGNATPGQIMRAINATIPAGTVAWVNITGATGGGAFVLAHTPLGATPP